MINLENQPIWLRVFLNSSIALALGIVTWLALGFMANDEVNKFAAAAVALLLGIFGVWLLYWVLNQLISPIPFGLRERLRPIIFVGPALLLLGIYLIYPALNTLWVSVSSDILPIPEILPEAYWDDGRILENYAGDQEGLAFSAYLFDGELFEVARVERNGVGAWLMVRTATIDDQYVFTLQAVGLHNYRFVFTNSDMHIAFRNNILWLIFGTGGSVLIGLLFASFVDRIKREALAKTFVFLPLAISFVGASVIWRFVYAWQPVNRPQIGLLNAIFVSTCGWLERTMPSLLTELGLLFPYLLKGGACGPISWLRISEPPINTLALIVIMVWLQTGFCMVILSAALKGVPNDLIEAARIDGANERQVFFRVVIPSIRGALITVTTTVFIAILKVFDIVFVMTSGQQDTEVLANRMFKEMFNFRNFGHASALAVVLLVVVLPIMVMNIRNLRQQGAAE